MALYTYRQMPPTVADTINDRLVSTARDRLRTIHFEVLATIIGLSVLLTPASN